MDLFSFLTLLNMEKPEIIAHWKNRTIAEKSLYFEKKKL